MFVKSLKLFAHSKIKMALRNFLRGSQVEIGDIIIHISLLSWSVRSDITFRMQR